MPAHTQHIREYGRDGNIIRTKQIIDDERQTPAMEGDQVIVARLIWYVADIVLALLAFRFVLALLGANTTNAFASFIFSVSHSLVAPFFGIFNYNFRYGVSRFEAYTLVAMAVYALIAFAITRLLTINRRHYE